MFITRKKFVCSSLIRFWFQEMLRYKVTMCVFLFWFNLKLYSAVPRCKLFLNHTVESRYSLHRLPLFGSRGVGAGTLWPAGRWVCSAWSARYLAWNASNTPWPYKVDPLPLPFFICFVTSTHSFFFTESRYRWFFFHQCLQYVKHDF